MKISTDKSAIERAVTHNVSEAVVRESLLKKLRSGKKLRVKLGADPTRPDLHLGHVIVLRKLREFQEMGHQVVFIIGDFTALIGDPSGRNKSRPPLLPQEIKENSETYFRQVGKVLDIKKTEVRFNSEWLKKLKLADVIRLQAQFTAARILERDDFTKRLAAGTDIAMHEFLYPMLQAYDSVAIRADIEIGGTDQTFNLLAGRDLQRKMSFPEQDIIICPLLVGLDGVEKMSKSTGNYIAIQDTPEDIFGKIMSLPDHTADIYFDFLTEILPENRSSHPRDRKAQLAKEIIKAFYHTSAAQKAQKHFQELFQKHEIPKNIPSVKIKRSPLGLLDLLVQVKFAPSRSEAQRSILQGAVKINQQKVTDWKKEISVSSGDILQVGKRRFVKIIL